MDMACHHGGNEGTNAISDGTDSGSNITFYWGFVRLFIYFRNVGSLNPLPLVARRYAPVKEDSAVEIDCGTDHLGPVSTYMTLCVGGCSKFLANDAQWFKIDAKGFDSEWASKDLIKSWFCRLGSGRVTTLTN